MKKICYILLLLAFSNISLASTEPLLEDDVYVLTDDNFDEFVSSQEFLLIDFYAPWCGHCKSLAPEFAAAAKKLKQHSPPYHLAKLDATVNTKQFDNHNISGYPTIILYAKGKQIEYRGGRTQSEMVKWVLQKTGSISKELSCEKLFYQTKQHKFILAYLGNNEELAEDFEKFIDITGSNHKIVQEYQFVHTFEKGCREGLFALSENSSHLLAFRQFDNRYVIYPKKAENWTVEEITSWMKESSIPSIFNFSLQYKNLLFEENYNAVILFRDDEDYGAEFAFEFEKVSKKFKGQILFIESNNKEGVQKRLADYMEVTQVPCIKIFEGSSKKIYNYEGALEHLTTDSLSNFITNFKKGKLQPYYRSEELPADEQTDAVKKVVGKTFSTIVQREENDVFIVFYTIWNEKWTQLEKVWEELGSELKSIPELVIAKFDAAANEVEDLKLRTYPDIKFYPKGPNSQVINYEGETDLHSLKNWLKEHSNSYKEFLEKKTDL